MKNQRIVLSLLSLVFLFASCMSNNNSEADKNDQSAEVKAQTGGCILCNELGEVPEDLYQVTEVFETDEFPPFNKAITSMGITLLGNEKISDDFMEKVAKAIQAMFDPNGPQIDKNLQEKMIANMYKYRATIPLFLGHNYDMSEVDEAAWEETTKKISACDIIMEAVPTQINEVVEHILHHVTDVGLHYTFPEEWGINTSSKAYHATQDAINKGFYEVEDYGDIDDPETYNRVLIQEYAYWIIFDVWELREPFFPRDTEFNVKTSADLKEKLPSSYDLVMETIPKVMVRPSDELLIELFGIE